MSSGLILEHRGHKTRLKWHRLRRRTRDPLFCAETMAAGFGIGASMELDLRVRKDGGFVVLHDADLHGETTGNGLIVDQNREDLHGIFFADGRRPLTLSEDLAQMLKSANPGALLQFDMKDDFATVGPVGVAHLQDCLTDIAAPVIISADCLELITAVRHKVPQVMRGFDPTNRLVEIARRDGFNAVVAELRGEIDGETKPHMIYLAWQLILAASRQGYDLIDLCHSEGKLVDAWTFTMKNPDTGFSPDEWVDFSALMDLKPDQITTDEALVTETEWQKHVA